jgi:hypothetical protein
LEGVMKKILFFLLSIAFIISQSLGRPLQDYPEDCDIDSSNPVLPSYKKSELKFSNYNKKTHEYIAITKDNDCIHIDYLGCYDSAGQWATMTIYNPGGFDGHVYSESELKGEIINFARHILIDREFNLFVQFVRKLTKIKRNDYYSIAVNDNEDDDMWLCISETDKYSNVIVIEIHALAKFN